jgi:hypothetical protein
MWLQARIAKNLPYFMDLDECGNLSSCGFVLEGVFTLFQSFCGDTVLMIDFTHNKTRFGLRLFSISTITQLGTTKVKVFIGIL